MFIKVTLNCLRSEGSRYSPGRRLFKYICGTSTGSAMKAARRVELPSLSTCGAPAGSIGQLQLKPCRKQSANIEVHTDVSCSTGTVQGTPQALAVSE